MKTVSNRCLAPYNAINWYPQFLIQDGIGRNIIGFINTDGQVIRLRKAFVLPLFLTNRPGIIRLSVTDPSSNQLSVAYPSVDETWNTYFFHNGLKERWLQLNNAKNPTMCSDTGRWDSVSNRCIVPPTTAVLNVSLALSNAFANPPNVSIMYTNEYDIYNSEHGQDTLLFLTSPVQTDNRVSVWGAWDSHGILGLVPSTSATNVTTTTEALGDMILTYTQLSEDEQAYIEYLRGEINVSPIHSSVNPVHIRDDELQFRVDWMSNDTKRQEEAQQYLKRYRNQLTILSSKHLLFPSLSTGDIRTASIASFQSIHSRIPVPNKLDEKYPLLNTVNVFPDQNPDVPLVQPVQPVLPVLAKQTKPVPVTLTLHPSPPEMLQNPNVCAAYGRWNESANQCETDQCAPGFEPTLSGEQCVSRVLPLENLGWTQLLGASTHTRFVPAANYATLDSTLFGYLSQTVIRQLPTVVLDEWKLKYGFQTIHANVEESSTVPPTIPATPITPAIPTIPAIPLVSPETTEFRYRGEYDPQRVYALNDVVASSPSNDIFVSMQSDNQSNALDSNAWRPATPEESKSINLSIFQYQSLPPLLQTNVSGGANNNKKDIVAKRVKRWMGGNTNRRKFVHRWLSVLMPFHTLKWAIKHAKKTTMVLGFKPAHVFVWNPRRRIVWSGVVNNTSNTIRLQNTIDDRIVHIHDRHDFHLL